MGVSIPISEKLQADREAQAKKDAADAQAAAMEADQAVFDAAVAHCAADLNNLLTGAACEALCTEAEYQLLPEVNELCEPYDNFETCTAD